MNNKKGFTLVELLAVIVILAILMVSAGAGVMATMNNSKINTFKNEVLTMINSAKDMYSEISMNMQNSSDFLVNSGESNYSGMCVTLAGLVNNGYLDKDIGTYGGVILVEVPYDGGETKYMAWVHNSTYGINGIEKNSINKLKYKKTNNTTTATNSTVATSNGNASTINGGSIGIVTKLDGINLVISQAMSGTGTSTTSLQKGNPTSLGNGSTTGTQYRIAKLESVSSRGGTGEYYTNIPCINVQLS